MEALWDFRFVVFVALGFLLLTNTGPGVAGQETNITSSPDAGAGSDPATNTNATSPVDPATTTNATSPVDNATNTNATSPVDNATNTNATSPVDNTTNTNATSPVDNATNTNATTPFDDPLLFEDSTTTNTTTDAVPANETYPFDDTFVDPTTTNTTTNAVPANETSPFDDTFVDPATNINETSMFDDAPEDGATNTTDFLGDAATTNETSVEPTNTTTNATARAEDDIWNPSNDTLLDEPGAGNDTNATFPFDTETETDPAYNETSYNVTDVTSPDDDNTTVTSIVDGPDGGNDTVAQNTTAATGVVPAVDTYPATARKPEKADFVVLNAAGEPCLLASLNITVHVKYSVQEGLVKETYDTVSRKDADDDSSFTGSCEGNESKLSITWNNNTFTLNLTFLLQDNGRTIAEEDNVEMDVLPMGTNSTASWTLHTMALTYDTKDQLKFPKAANPSVQTVFAENLKLFDTPPTMSYVCETPEAVGVTMQNVNLVFNSVRLQPFGATSTFFANETVECSGDLGVVPGAAGSSSVPLMVAGCLAAIVIVIIIAYAGHRCVAAKVRQADYKQME